MSMLPSIRRALAAAALSTLALAACGGDDESSDHHGEPAETVAPTADAVVVDVDADAAEPGTQTVPLGSTVSLHIISTEEHEFHLHGYDLEAEGTDLTLTFVADEAGEFEVETHDTEELVFTLVVE
jgi:hypothetical protein